VTGATGQGKSTQVPKLLLYALKVIDYKSNGKVICTQPRVPPTVGNATRISDELGVSLGLNDHKKFYVQYQHSDSRHTKNVNHLSMKFVTDGSLLVEIKTPTLKAEPYFANNLYDIVIVDEAHEHNANMDIILSLMKYVCLGDCAGFLNVFKIKGSHNAIITGIIAADSVYDSI
jgi:HrpA-like RNA helicase